MAEEQVDKRILSDIEMQMMQSTVVKNIPLDFIEEAFFEEIEIKAYQDGIWRRFMLETIEGQETARQILRFQKFLNDNEKATLYHLMIEKVRLNVLALKMDLPDMKLVGRDGQLIQPSVDVEAVLAFV